MGGSYRGHLFQQVKRMSTLLTALSPLERNQNTWEIPSDRQNVRQIQTLKIARTSGYRTDKLMYVLNLGTYPKPGGFTTRTDTKQFEEK